MPRRSKTRERQRAKADREKAQTLAQQNKLLAKRQEELERPLFSQPVEALKSPVTMERYGKSLKDYRGATTKPPSVSPVEDAKKK